MLTLKLEDNGSDTLIIFWDSGELQKVLGINAWHYDALLWSYAAIFLWLFIYVDLFMEVSEWVENWYQ